MGLDGCPGLTMAKLPAGAEGTGKVAVWPCDSGLGRYELCIMAKPLEPTLDHVLALGQIIG